jgi:Do/DeqQ family serine protease
MTSRALRGTLFVLLVLAALGGGAALHAVLTRNPARLGPAAGSSPSAQQLQTAFSGVVQQVRPVVVNIGTVQRGGGRRPSGPELYGRDDPQLREFFEQFFGPGPSPSEFRLPGGVGSGVIIDRRGYILTNFHVVKGADEITVKLASKREYRGQVVGTDPTTDLAVIRIQPDTELAVAALGNSDHLRVGEWAIAIGNPFGLTQTVTVGVISATGRSDVGIATHENFIQTDASINPGNSGGPLLNVKGEVVGINTAIVSLGHGIGFAIPINMAKRVMHQLVDKGKVVRGWMGVAVQPVTAELAQSLGASGTAGAVVASVYAGSPAEKAGLQQGDLIVAFDGTRVEDYQHLQRLVAETEVGKTVALEILRKQRPLSVKLEITEQAGGATRRTR